jgi:hypothetical protein
MYTNLLCSASALFLLAQAHFQVNYPPPLGSNIDNEDTAPCGGFTPSSSDKLTDFHVGGDAIAITTLHAQSNIGYFGTLSSAPTNFTLLFPIIQQYGLNGFCEPMITTPASWAGSAGLLQIVQDAEDGVHYQVSTHSVARDTPSGTLTDPMVQCMHVNFVAGMGSTQSACTNSSGNSASFMSDPVIVSADGAAAAAPTGTGSSTSMASGMTMSGMTMSGMSMTGMSTTATGTAAPAATSSKAAAAHAWGKPDVLIPAVVLAGAAALAF